MPEELSEIVYAWHGQRAQGPVLWAALRRLIDRMSARYPRPYFEMGVRDETALDSLTNRVFTHCDRTAHPYDPFRNRAPFRAYTEERMPSRPIRYHTVFSWRSVARAVLRDDYRKNIRRDPALRWRDQLYRRLSRVLPEVAEAVPSTEGRAPRWRTRAKGLHRVRSEEEVRAQLLRMDLPWDAIRALEPAALGTLAATTLDLLGTPLSQSALAHLLADALRAPLSAMVALDDTLVEDREAPDAAPLRAALLAGWVRLEPLDRALAIGLAQGEDAETLMARDPRIGSRPTLTRALARIGEQLLTPILADSHLIPDPTLKPQQRMERIMDVLLDLLPELP